MYVNLNYAYMIEGIVCKYLKCETRGFGELVYAKYYQENPLEAAIEIAVRSYEPKHKGAVDNFFAKWRTMLRNNQDNLDSVMSEYISDLEEFANKLIE